MIANHIHDALAQVKVLQEFILEKRLFGGYSGKARIISGSIAIMGAAVMATDIVPAEPLYYLAGWVAVLAVGVGVNYGYLLWWFMFDRDVRRNPVMMKPAVDALPALGAGALFTMVFIMKGYYDLLFGMWMCLYGLAQVAYRQSLPKGIYYVGICYMLCGAFFLLYSDGVFMNPWPMGIVFFTGEIAGGLVLLRYRLLAQCDESESLQEG